MTHTSIQFLRFYFMIKASKLIFMSDIVTNLDRENFIRAFIPNY